MCDLCRQNPCHNMCPNAEPVKVIGLCDWCERELRADETYFTDDNDNIFCCQECALNYYGVREEDYDGD